MSRTIEAIMAHTAPAKRHAIPADEKRLTAIWQNGVESAGHVQRKLRLTFMNVSAFQPAIERQNMRARHFDSESHNEAMKRFVFVSAVIFVALLFVGCGCKSQPAGPPAPEVLVTTVQPRDVPRVIERVATLDGFINANINAQVQGYLIGNCAWSSQNRNRTCAQS